MELEFTDDQDALRDSIRAVLTHEAPIALAREVAEHGRGADRLARVVAELGWGALTVPEQFGGIGLGPVEAGILAEELGRVVAPGPLLATVCGFVPFVDALGDDAQRARWLGAVATEASTGSIAVDGDVRSEFDGDTVVLRGTARYVIEAAAADALCIVTNSGTSAVVVARSEIEPVAINSVDPTRALAHLRLNDLRVSADRVLGGGRDVHAEIESATLAMVGGLALETVGACQAVFDTALDYAKQRSQFGVPIGSFQAIKHKFADMIVLLERARATGYLAALCRAEHDERAAINTAVAKAAAGDCQRKFAKEGIQILGGIGYTWEADMHLYVKRIKANEALFGTSGYHRSRIADLLGV